MTDKPTIDETYSRAGNTSNLTVEADRRGAGDVLIAAGMVGLSPSKSLGMALMRLHSEYDSGFAGGKAAGATGRGGQADRAGGSVGHGAAQR